jgi:hypothetical protein
MLDTWGEENKIIDGKDKIPIKVYMSIGAPDPGSTDPIGKMRVDTVLRYRHVGMDYATAEDCQDTLNDPPDVVAQLERTHANGTYGVNVAETIEGEWEPIYPPTPAT